MLRKLLEHWLLAVFVIVLFTLGVVVDWVSHKRASGQLLLRSVAQLKLGQSTFADAQALAEEYGGKPWTQPSKTVRCSAQACTFRFAFDNRPLSYIPRVPGVQFVAAVGVKDGYVIEREIDYTILNSAHIDFAYLLLDHLDPADTFEVQTLKVDPDGTAHVLKVTLGQLATSDERQHAYSINLSCLARVRDCSNAAAVFPPGLR